MCLFKLSMVGSILTMSCQWLYITVNCQCFWFDSNMSVVVLWQYAVSIFDLTVNCQWFVLWQEVVSVIDLTGVSIFDLTVNCQWLYFDSVSVFDLIVSCLIWEGSEVKKVELTGIDIGWTIIEKVDNIPESSDYIWIGLVFSLIIGCIPIFFKVYHTKEFFSLLNLHALVDLLWSLNADSWRSVTQHNKSRSAKSTV